MTQPTTGGNLDLSATSDDGPYVLRSLLEDVPLSEDGSKSDVKINCIEYFGTGHPTESHKAKC